MRDEIEESPSAPAHPSANSVREAQALALLEGAAAQTPRSGGVRVKNEPAYILATWPWRETSVVAELFTEHHGRVAVTIKGAKRPGGKFRGLINAFSPLLVSYSGAGEVRNLTDAKWLGGLSAIPSESLVSAFYVTELVLRMTVREDPNSALFGAYTEVLTHLAHDKGSALEAALRTFEVRLLTALGWGQPAGFDEVERAHERLWAVRKGVLRTVESLMPDEAAVPFDVVRAIAHCDFEESATIRRARPVLRAIIGYYVGDRGLQTRSTIARWAGL